MLKKTISYTDYNEVERKEDHYFNLSKAELMEMEMGTTGDLLKCFRSLLMLRTVHPL